MRYNSIQLTPYVSCDSSAIALGLFYRRTIFCNQHYQSTHARSFPETTLKTDKGFFHPNFVKISASYHWRINYEIFYGYKICTYQFSYEIREAAHENKNDKFAKIEECVLTNIWFIINFDLYILHKHMFKYGFVLQICFLRPSFFLNHIIQKIFSVCRKTKTNTKIGEKDRCDKEHIHTHTLYDVQNINFGFMRNLIKKLKAISAFFHFRHFTVDSISHLKHTCLYLIQLVFKCTNLVSAVCLSAHTPIKIKSKIIRSNKYPTPIKSIHSFSIFGSFPLLF